MPPKNAGFDKLVANSTIPNAAVARLTEISRLGGAFLHKDAAASRPASKAPQKNAWATDTEAVESI